MSKLKELFSYKSLHASYEATRARAKSSPAHGVDNVSFRTFDKNIGGNLRSLSKAVLSGEYRHLPLRAFAIPKPEGRERWICIPTHRDRLLQRVLLFDILENYHSSLETHVGFGSFRYQPSENETDAAKLVCGLKAEFPYAVKTDIMGYFDGIDRSDAKKQVRRFVRHRSIWPLLDQVIEAEAAADKDTSYALAKGGVLLGKGIRQGMPLSPLLAHTVLIELDKYIKANKIIAVRYVDDILIMGRTAEETAGAFELIRAWLARNRGLSVPAIGEGKTVQYGALETIKFLGIEIYRRQDDRWYRRIPKGMLQKVRERIESRIPEPTADLKPRSISRAMAFIVSMRQSYQAAYGDLDGWHEVDRKLGELEVFAIRRFSKLVGSYSEERTIDTKAKRAFGLRAK